MKHVRGYSIASKRADLQGSFENHCPYRYLQSSVIGPSLRKALDGGSGEQEDADVLSYRELSG